MNQSGFRGISERIDPTCRQLSRGAARGALDLYQQAAHSQQAGGAGQQATQGDPHLRAKEVLQPAGHPAGATVPALVLAGGEALGLFKHPLFQTFEQQYRIEPSEGWFQPNISRTNPVIFNLGSYVVPPDQTLWLFDYEFSVYRPSGQDPGDFVAAEEGRFSNQMGFDLTIGGIRPGDLMFELVPHAAIAGGSAFLRRTGPARPASFQLAQARSFGLTSGPATSMLPVRRAVQGPEGAPFTFIADEDQVVSMGCAIFSRITAPLACVQGNLRGYRMASVLSDKLLAEVRP